MCFHESTGVTGNTVLIPKISLSPAVERFDLTLITWISGEKYYMFDPSDPIWTCHLTEMASKGLWKSGLGSLEKVPDLDWRLDHLMISMVRELVVWLYVMWYGMNCFRTCTKPLPMHSLLYVYARFHTSHHTSTQHTQSPPLSSVLINHPLLLQFLLHHQLVMIRLHRFLRKQHQHQQ